MKQRASLFERLKTGLEDLREYAQGERELVEIELSLPEPPRRYAAADVVAIRDKLGLSQSSLALLMHVSAKTVQSWEQGLRAPSGVASRMLQVLEAPEAFIASIPRTLPRKRSATG